MKQKQLLKIQSLLRDWRSERHLDIYGQIANIEANLFEEVVEYLRAKDECEKIDALCDMIVFCVNTMSCNFIDTEEYKPNLKGETDKGIFCLILENIELIYKILDETLERGWEANKDNVNLILSKGVFLCCELIKRAGYDPYNCLLETIKEISSRKGEYNETIKKFVKYQGAYTDFEANEIVSKLSPEAPFKIIKEDAEYWYYGIEAIVQGQLVKWYRADYSKCKK